MQVSAPEHRVVIHCYQLPIDVNYHFYRLMVDLKNDVQVKQVDAVQKIAVVDHLNQMVANVIGVCDSLDLLSGAWYK
jgi:hypothetical protein